MRSYEAKAKNQEEAISIALKELGVSLADVNIEIIDEGKKGVLGILGSKPVVVRVTVKEENDTDVLEEVFEQTAVRELPKKEKKTEAPAVKRHDSQNYTQPKTETVKTEPPITPKIEANVAIQLDEKKASVALKTEQKERAYDFVSQLTKLMGVEVSVEVLQDEEGNIRVNMTGDTLGILIGRRGETLDSLQYLTSLYVNQGLDGYTRVTLDTENYRAKREDALIRLANRMANRAVKTGRKVVMEPMNPYERRIFHSALQGNEYVTTHSEGEEPNRHVVITLK